MRPDDAPAASREVLDHVVVGAGLSGLAYAWRRLQEGRRVLVVEASGRIAATPPAVVEGAAPHLERLLEVLPGAARLEAPPCGALRVWTRSGLRPRAPSTLRRILRRPGSLALEVRSVLRGGRAHGPTALRVLGGGTGELRRTLSEALGDRLQLDLPVTRVRPRGDGRAHVVVETRDGGIEARAAALDVSAGEQARLLAGDRPYHADVLGAVPYANAVLVGIEVPRDRLPPIAGFERGADVRGRMQSALFLSHLAPDADGPGLVEGRLEGPAVTALDDGTLRRVASVELDRALGRHLQGRVTTIRHVRYLQPEPGHRRRMAELAADLGGQGVRLLGAVALGAGPDRLASAGAPVPGPLPDGVAIA